MENNAHSNSYLSFKLGKASFAIHTNFIWNILELTNLVSVTCPSQYLKGFINMRGKVLPVVDLREKFRIPAVENFSVPSVIVIDIVKDGKEFDLGLMVDSLGEIMDIETNEMAVKEKIGEGPYALGYWKKGNRYVTLLDIENNFSIDELILIEQTRRLVPVTREVYGF